MKTKQERNWRRHKEVEMYLVFMDQKKNILKFQPPSSLTECVQWFWKPRLIILLFIHLFIYITNIIHPLSCQALCLALNAKQWTTKALLSFQTTCSIYPHGSRTLSPTGLYLHFSSLSSPHPTLRSAKRIIIHHPSTLSTISNPWLQLCAFRCMLEIP